MSEKEIYAIKMAICIMERNHKRYFNMMYGNMKTGVRIGYGEAIGILEDILRKDIEKEDHA